MKFECGDLERALASPELMPEVAEHLKICAECRREFRLWKDISSSARSLHTEWESPALWPNIRAALEEQRKLERRGFGRNAYWVAAAGVLLAASLSIFLWLHGSGVRSGEHGSSSTLAKDRDFLTDQALLEVERSETAYRSSIDKLSRLAEAKLEKAQTAQSASVRERLSMLDSAIQETRSNVAVNRFNVHLQTALADLYRQKQQTLEELLASERKQ